MACVHHPRANQALLIDGHPYCARCQAQIRAAVARLDRHVTPPECFVWYANSREGWQPIEGTGCAHYVSHELNIRVGHAGGRCVAGYTFRVPMMLTGRAPVTGGLAAVQVGHIWANRARTHTGLVSKVEAATGGAAGAAPVIWITHASSGQHKLATNRFDQYFHGQGDFFR